MLEEAADHRLHADILRQARHAGAQAADAADDEIDLDPAALAR
jgi:predicted DNA-binding protein